jgi:hypothetical protein
MPPFGYASCAIEQLLDDIFTDRTIATPQAPDLEFDP